MDMTLLMKGFVLMVQTANLGYPRFGAQRELKRMLESFWSGKINQDQLQEQARSLRQTHWKTQQQAGINYIPSNDFSFYDHVLDTAVMVGAIPERYGWSEGSVDLTTYFAMARGGQDHAGIDIPAMEMTKWFDTNYHYLVPEFVAHQQFQLTSCKPLDMYQEAKAQGIETRPVLLGPVSFLLLGKSLHSALQPIQLLEQLLPVYIQILHKLAASGVEWIQIDEPCLVLDLDQTTQAAYLRAYSVLQAAAPQLKLMLTTYFGELGSNAELAFSLPVAGIHVDLVRAPEQLAQVSSHIPDQLTLSLGLIDGRNIWRADLDTALQQLASIRNNLPNNPLIIAPSCSLLHVPVDLQQEQKLDTELRSWLAFANQKLREVQLLAACFAHGEELYVSELAEQRNALASRRTSQRVHNPSVQTRLQAITPQFAQRTSVFAQRRQVQIEQLALPILPTTTIGSFPQTAEVRKYRADVRAGRITPEQYNEFLKSEIARTIKIQEEIGLDVLVHGESERTDMVEYFGEQLSGIAFTQHGWVQSYGSRGVRPPVIYGDVTRPSPMTVEWSSYAQSLTNKHVKGMLTGPITILQWSFVRNDIPREQTARQIALALRDEVQDLEQAGIQIIQIDEPALREGLPLRQAEWANYLAWAVEAFKIASCSVRDQTQIHTHMCYAEFNDIIEAIIAMDADVISIESSRSKMELLQAFHEHHYPNEIGPGVYDIHSPLVPNSTDMLELLQRALTVLSPEQLWVNPDCGLKTRRWEEVTPALHQMVEATIQLRNLLAQQHTA
jgi:5-methyltetrahydropteroyltriglutamate--homocysteine methyltransferase